MVAAPGWLRRAATGLPLGSHVNGGLRLRASIGVRRRLYRRRVDRHTADILRDLDRREFHRRFRDDPVLQGMAGMGSSKYIFLEKWMRVAVERFFAFGCDRLPAGSRVLDIGCGSGFFLLVCEHFGHEAVGLDLDLDDLYNAQIEFFGLERTTHHIRPGEPLPDMDRPFDLVTAFMMAFHWRMYTDEPWSGDEWRAFLPELCRLVSDGGRVLFSVNRNPVTGDYVSREAQLAIKSHPGISARFFAHCVELRVNR